jgi:hypothetical protein
MMKYIPFMREATAAAMTPPLGRSADVHRGTIDPLIEAFLFLRAFTNIEYCANHASHTEPCDKLRQLARGWSAMFADELRSDLVCPRGDPAPPRASADDVAATSPPQRCSILAVARYHHDQGELFRGWLGDAEPGPRGEGMRRCLYVAREAGRLKVVACYEVCSCCFGAGAQRAGEICQACGGAGWFHRGGRRCLVLGRMLELRKLGPPADRRYRRGYDAIG